MVNPPNNFAVYVCQCVFEKKKLVKYIVLEDGDLQFLCGDNHREGELPKVIGFGHMRELVRSIPDFYKLKDGEEFGLVDGQWVRRVISE